MTDGAPSPNTWSKSEYGGAVIKWATSGQKYGSGCIHNDVNVGQPYIYTSTSGKPQWTFTGDFTIRGWWKEDSLRTQRYYNNILEYQGKAPESCEPEICKKIINQHLQSPSMWTIFPIQDILGISKKLRRQGDPKKEQINNPANPYHRWNFRMHINIEALIEEKEFNSEIAEMIKESRRTTI